MILETMSRKNSRTEHFQILENNHMVFFPRGQNLGLVTWIMI